MRLFAALELPAGARQALAAWAAALPEDPALRVVPAENLHVTLVFLGRQDDADAAAIAAAVTGAARPLAPLSVTGAAWLPGARRPGVLVADLDAPDELAVVHAELLTGLAPWHEPERRPLRPHVTVARVRRGMRPRVADLPVPPTVSFSAAALVLYRSHTGPRGARYEPLARAPLA